MQNPPEAVKLTMESVCILLGHKVDSWKAVQAVARKDDFIVNIATYDTSNLTSKIRMELEATYMTHKSFSFEIVNRASKACGPLLQWVVAQIKYAAILDKVGPLRIQVAELENKAVEAREQAVSTQNLLAKLEHQISVYRKEYADLIAEVERLKKELESVKCKMERSICLIQGLSSEKARWETSR
jgi:dynein heavy chain 1